MGAFGPIRIIFSGNLSLRREIGVGAGTLEAGGYWRDAVRVHAWSMEPAGPGLELEQAGGCGGDESDRDIEISRARASRTRAAFSPARSFLSFPP